MNIDYLNNMLYSSCN